LGQRTVRNRLPPPPDSSISITYSSPLVAVRSPSAPRPAPHKAFSPSSSRPPRSATPPRSRSDSLSAHPRVRSSPCPGGINHSVVTVTVYRPGCLNVMVRFSRIGTRTGSPPAGTGLSIRPSATGMRDRLQPSAGRTSCLIRYRQIGVGIGVHGVARRFSREHEIHSYRIANEKLRLTLMRLKPNRRDLCRRCRLPCDRGPSSSY